MTRTSLFYKTLSLITFSIIGIFAYHTGLHTQYTAYRNSQHASVTLKRNLEILKKEYVAKDNTVALFAQTQSQFNAAIAAIPSAQNFNTALNTVKTAGENDRLQIQSIIPGNPSRKNFYSEIPVQIIVVGTYQQILTFMQTTTTWNGPLFIWKNWTLSHQSTPKTTVLNETTNNDLLQMHVDAVFFYTP